MCTITYLPINNGFIVTQNRDESPLRKKAHFPINGKIKEQHIIYPKDPEGSGSWFVSTKEITICVMNAVYHFNKTSADFKHSRGLVPLHYLEFNDSESFVKNYDFKGIQGFTLVVCSKNSVHNIHWDEEKIVHTKHASTPLIFQSNPLYNASQKAKRKGWFNTWVKNNKPDNILDFHKSQEQNNLAESILMDRKIVQTVSIIQRVNTANSNVLAYAEKENLKNFRKVLF